MIQISFDALQGFVAFSEKCFDLLSGLDGLYVENLGVEEDRDKAPWCRDIVFLGWSISYKKWSFAG